MPSIHRTARGLAIDIEQLRLANEETVAVGNHRVNARGDMLDSQGKIMMTRDEVMANHYNNTNKTFNIPVDQPVVESSNHAKSLQRAEADVIDEQRLQDTISRLTKELAEKNALLSQQPIPQEMLPPVQSNMAQPEVEQVDASVEEVPKLRGGLAAAIAKNKEYMESKGKSKRL